MALLMGNELYQEVTETQRGGAEPIRVHIPDTVGSTPTPASITTAADLRAALADAMLMTLLVLVDEGRYRFPPGGLPSLLFQSSPEGNA